MFTSLLLVAAAPVSTAAMPVSPAAPTAQSAQQQTSTEQPPQRLPKPVPTPSGSTQPFVSSRPDIGFISAGALRDRCQSSASGLVSYCFAYITGVHDTVRAYETWLHFREFCPPYTGSQADLRRAFLTYLKANPAAETAEAASVVVLALKDQFACKDPEPTKADAKAAPGGKLPEKTGAKPQRR